MKILSAINKKNRKTSLHEHRISFGTMWFILSIALVSNTMFAQGAESAGRPNIVLVMADDMGWGDLGCFNRDSLIQTPHLDAMAKAGLKFNRFYSGGAVCSPTRGSCLTGRNPNRYGIYNANTGHMKDAEVTLPELLGKHGYSTGHFGKWHLGTLTTEIKDSNRGGPRNKKRFSTPTMNGYHECFVTEAKVPTFDPMVKPPKAGGKAWDYIADHSKALPYGTRYWDHKGNIVTENLKGDDSRVIVDRALKFITKAAESNMPSFTVVWFHAPHLPVVAGPEHVKPYAAHDVYTRNYYGCISALDEQVGRLRKTLRDLKVAENTMVWFCSDNGPEGKTGKAPGSAGSLRGRKRSLYEGGVRVPGILEWPGKVKPGSVTDFPAVTSDYLPTILDILGLEMPDQRPIDGISLLPMMEGRSTERTTPIGFQSRSQVSAVGQRYKLYTSDKGKNWELYDLKEDEGETTDLAAKQPVRVKELSRWVRDWLQSVQASDNEKDYPQHQ